MVLRQLLLIPAILLFAGGPAAAVPEADHVLIECDVLRLAVNSHSMRHQIKIHATVSSSDEDSLELVPMSLMDVTNPVGERVTLGCYSKLHTPKQFKAASTRVMFRAVGDTSAEGESNTPEGFFESAGPYLIELHIRDELFSGEVYFGEPLTMEVRQQGRPVSNFVLRDEAGMDVYTAPDEFGPVYYKQQDLSNFVFQMANIENALETGDYHTPVESPRYLFQVRIGDGDGGPARLLDPSRYIEGWQPHMIRSEQTTTPLHFAAEEFVPGDVVVVDFRRIDSLEPDSLFTSDRSKLSSNVEITERVIYALSVETAPTAEELGLAEAPVQRD